MVSKTMQTQHKLVLHVGCGPANPKKLHRTFQTKEWQEIRFDIDPNVKPDIVGSLTNMEAISNDSVDAVWSSHNIEHLYAHEVAIALGEFHRVLKPGGMVLITLPDLQKVAEYVALGKLEDTLYVSPAGPIAAIDIIYGFGAAISRGNHYMAHKTGFTAQSLGQKLASVGFQNIRVERENLNLWAKASK